MSKLKDFEIMGQLGKGAFGVVYKVRRKADQKIYCVKQVNIQQLNRKEQEEAVNEVKILAAMDNPYVIRYYDSFVDQNALNIVMEVAQKGNLYDKLKAQRGKKLPEADIWNLFIQTTLALNYIHSKKILHRDVKSLNIFLDHGDKVKVGDLGVARVMSANTNFARTIVGTPYYLSPEICEDKPYNAKSDVWSLGCVLYELCTLKPPFDANSQGALILKIIRGKYPPIPQVYSFELSDLVRQLLTRDTRRRPDTAQILNMPNIQKKASDLGIPIPSEPIMYKSPSNVRALRNVPATQQNQNKAQVRKPGGLNLPKRNIPNAAKAGPQPRKMRAAAGGVANVPPAQKVVQKPVGRPKPEAPGAKKPLPRPVAPQAPVLGRGAGVGVGVKKPEPVVGKKNKSKEKALQEARDEVAALPDTVLPSNRVVPPLGNPSPRVFGSAAQQQQQQQQQQVGLGVVRSARDHPQSKSPRTGAAAPISARKPSQAHLDAKEKILAAERRRRAELAALERQQKQEAAAVNSSDPSPSSADMARPVSVQKPERPVPESPKRPESVPEQSPRKPPQNLGFGVGPSRPAIHPPRVGQNAIPLKPSTETNVVPANAPSPVLSGNETIATNSTAGKNSTVGKNSTGKTRTIIVRRKVTPQPIQQQHAEVDFKVSSPQSTTTASSKLTVPSPTSVKSSSPGGSHAGSPAQSPGATLSVGDETDPPTSEDGDAAEVGWRVLTDQEAQSVISANEINNEAEEHSYDEEEDEEEEACEEESGEVEYEDGEYEENDFDEDEEEEEEEGEEEEEDLFNVADEEDVEQMYPDEIDNAKLENTLQTIRWGFSGSEGSHETKGKGKVPDVPSEPPSPVVLSPKRPMPPLSAGTPSRAANPRHINRILDRTEKLREQKSQARQRCVDEIGEKLFVELYTFFKERADQSEEEDVNESADLNETDEVTKFVLGRVALEKAEVITHIYHLLYLEEEFEECSTEIEQLLNEYQHNKSLERSMELES